MSEPNGSMGESALTMEPETGAAATEESTVESTDAWTCVCGTVNDPDHLPEDGDPDICTSCGASAFLQDEEDPGDEDGAGTPTIDDIKAGLQNLSGGIATSQDIENAARAEEGLPPKGQSDLPLDFGPFNPDAALKAIFEKQAEIIGLQADYAEKKEWANDAKKELDKANVGLVNIIESFKKRRQQALHPSQPYLREVSDTAAPAKASCPWERDHPGQDCPICSRAKAEQLVPAVESEVHPEHEGHTAVAEAARVKNVLDPLADKLVALNVFTESIELQQLTTEELTALIAYAEEPTPMPPQLVARCCRAAEPGSIVQVCLACEQVLHTGTNGGTPYPVGALVGFNCKAYVPRTGDAPVEEAVSAPPATEPVRTIKPRGTAKKRSRKQPEQERVKQTEAGRKAAKAPKAKTAAKRAKGKR